MPAGAGILSGSDIPVRNEGFLTQAGEFHSDLWNSRHHVDLCGHRAICDHLGVHAALVMADVLYFLVFILCFALGFCTRHHLHGGNAENI